MKNVNNIKKPSSRKDSDYIYPPTSHTQNEEKTLKKFCSDNPDIAERLDEIDLSKVRISQKNLVYVIGLSNDIAKEETLMKNEYFGQYGYISKIVVYKNSSYNRNQKYSPSLSAYLTFSDEKEASLAIFAVDGFEIHEKTLHCSYGTTKYCSFFLRDQVCPNKPDCVYLHSISKDHEYYYLNNHKNGTEDQKNSILNVLRRYKKEFASFITMHNKAEAPKSIFPSIVKIIYDVNQIFINETAINMDDNINVKKLPKTILSKSNSSNTEDKSSNTKKDTSIKKAKPPNKLINIVDWEDEAAAKKEKEREKNSAEPKSPESKMKFSEDLKNTSNDKINPNSAQNFNQTDDFLSNPSPKDEDSSAKIQSHNNFMNEMAKSPESRIIEVPKSPASLEEDLLKFSEMKGVGDSFELIQKQNEEREECLNEMFNLKKTSPNEQSLNCSNEKIKVNNESEKQLSPEFHKTSNEFNERKNIERKCKEEDSNFYNSLSFCNEIEKKIIKNMLNETNQKSRFSFVQSEQKKQDEKKDNSLKEILLTSLKINDFKRTCSLNFNECFEKDKESLEKEYNFCSHLNERDLCRVNLISFYSHGSHGEHTEFLMNHQDNNNNNDLNC